MDKLLEKQIWLNSCLYRVNLLLDSLVNERKPIGDNKPIFSLSTPQLADRLQSLKKILDLFNKDKERPSEYRSIANLLHLLRENLWFPSLLSSRASFTHDEEKKFTNELDKFQCDLAAYTLTLRWLYFIYHLKDKATTVLEVITRLIRDDQNLPFNLLELADQLQSFKSIVYAYQFHFVMCTTEVPRHGTIAGPEPGENELRSPIETLAELRQVLRAYGKFALSEEMETSWYQRQWPLNDEQKRSEVVKLQHKLAVHTSKLRSLRIGENTVKNSGIVFVVMGAKGSGKSYFVQQVFESRGVQNVRKWEYSPQKAQAFSVTLVDRTIILIDSSADVHAFDDGQPRTNNSTLLEIEASLKERGYLNMLYEVIYMYPITFYAGGKHLTSAFISLPSSSFWEFTLVTSMWNRLPPNALKDLQGKELQKAFGKIVGRSETMYARLSGEETASTLIERIVYGRKIAWETQDPLISQKEILNQQSSMNIVSNENAKLGEHEEKKPYGIRQPDQVVENEQKGVLAHPETGKLDEKALAGKRRDKEQYQDVKIDEKDGKETLPIAMETDRLEENAMPVKEAPSAQLKKSREPGEDQRTLTAGATRWKSTQAGDHDRLILTLFIVFINFFVRMLGPEKVNVTPLICETAAVCLPPLIMIWWQRIHQSAFVNRSLRPGLRKGYSRIEWTCSCGDLLYGDYVEKNPGSLQGLAAQLGGRVISGPASEASPSNGSDIPAPPPSARLRGGSTASIPAADAGRISSSNQPFHPAVQPASTSGSLATDTEQQRTRTSRYLELCIRSSPDTYALGELNIAGSQTDQTVFNKISEEYRRRRNSARFFGRFALRIPNGGVFVQFRKDKLGDSGGTPATASIMTRPSVPQPHEAKRYNYDFRPVPMDEPPMDERTFNHYFHKPHEADGAATWIKRFPKLVDSSLLHSKEKLAKGWGIEITEARNWMLFFYANVMALLLSGIIAGLSSICMHDKQTGIAIGAWLSTIQALLATALFWQWTNV